MAIYQRKDEKGTVIKDKKGNSWYYRCYYTDIYGNRKQRQSKMYSTKSEAQEEERKFLNSSINQKENITNMTFKDLYYNYYEYKKDKIRETTLDNFHKYFKKIEILHNVKLKDYSIKHFELWKKDANSHDWSVRYKNSIYTFLVEMIKYAISYLDITSLNTVLMKMTSFKNPNEMAKEMKYYTYEEYLEFISYEDMPEYKLAFDILYFMGLRYGELRGLQWKNIDFEKGTLTIDHQIPSSYTKLNYKITPPKTPKSNRTLPLNNLVLEELKEQKEKFCKYDDFSEDWFVISGSLPMFKGELIVEKNRIYEKSGITKKLRIHDWRHSCASFLINNGADATIVAKYLGHATIRRTLETYTHLFEDRLTEITNLINKKIEK